MKKALALALVLVLALSLAACGGSSNSGGSTTTPPTSNTQNGGNDTTTPPASQEETTTPTNSGGYADPIENWPSFLPETTMAGVVAESDDSHFLITFFGSSRDEIKAYVEELKTAGFNLNEELTDESDYYSFSASDNSGWSIGVNHNSGGAGMYGNKE
jgi:hypothetical protein